MTHCARCHRPLRKPTETGFGPVCVKKIAPPATVERDLFGYDTEAAAASANAWVAAYVEALAAGHRADLRAQFKEARMALGVV
mgnify:CR=1 FL=1